MTLPGEHQGHSPFVRLGSRSTNPSDGVLDHSDGEIHKEVHESPNSSVDSREAFLHPGQTTKHLEAGIVRGTQRPRRRRGLVQPYPRHQSAQQTDADTASDSLSQRLCFATDEAGHQGQPFRDTHHPGQGSTDIPHDIWASSFDCLRPAAGDSSDPATWTPSTWCRFNASIQEYPWSGIRLPARHNRAKAGNEEEHCVKRRKVKLPLDARGDVSIDPTSGSSHWWFGSGIQSGKTDIEMATRKTSPFAENSSDETLSDFSRGSTPLPYAPTADRAHAGRAGPRFGQSQRRDGLTFLNKAFNEPQPIDHWARMHPTLMQGPEEDASGVLSYDQALYEASAMRPNQQHTVDAFHSQEELSDWQRERRKSSHQSPRKFPWTLHRQQSRDAPTSVASFSDPAVRSVEQPPSSRGSDEDTLAFWTSDTDLDLVNTTPTFILLHRLISQWDEVLLYLEATHLRAFPSPSEPGQLVRYLLFRLPPVTLFMALAALFVWICFRVKVPPSLYGLMGSITVGLMAWATFFCQRTEEQGDRIREVESDALKKDWLQRRMKKRRRRRREERDRLKALIKTRHRAQLELAVREESSDQRRRDESHHPPKSGGGGLEAIRGSNGHSTPVLSKSQLRAKQAVALEEAKEAQADWVGQWSRQVSSGSVAARLQSPGRNKASLKPATPPAVSAGNPTTVRKPFSEPASAEKGIRVKIDPPTGWEGVLMPHSTSSIAIALGATAAARERAALAATTPPPGALPVTKSLAAARQNTSRRSSAGQASPSTTGAAVPGPLHSILGDSSHRAVRRR